MCLAALGCGPGEKAGGVGASPSAPDATASSDGDGGEAGEAPDANVVADAGDAGSAANDGGIVVLAEAVLHSARISSVAVDDAFVYWADGYNNRVLRTPLGGGPAAVLASSGTPDPYGLVVDSNYLYWASGGGQRILRCPKDASDCTPTVLAAPTIPTGMAIDQHNVYWWAAGNILACSLDGCRDQFTVVASGITAVYVVALATDGTSVYWASGHDVAKCPVSGCGDASTVLATGFDMVAPSIAVDSQNVYWTDDNGGGPSAGAVLKCAVSGCGGVPDVLTGDAGNPADLVTDGARVFFTQAHDPPPSPGSGDPIDVVTCPIDECGSAPTVLYTDNPVYEIALNQTRIIVATPARIVSVPKP